MELYVASPSARVQQPRRDDVAVGEPDTKLVSDSGFPVVNQADTEQHGLGFRQTQTSPVSKRPRMRNRVVSASALKTRSISASGLPYMCVDKYSTPVYASYIC